MYEAEVNDQTESPGIVPATVLDNLREYRALVESRTLMPWGEHCTECAWPTCYTTCDLYDPRVDGACRQFDGGVARVSTPRATTPYLQKITFRRWAKLWTLGRMAGHSLSRADFVERVNVVVGSAARLSPLPVSLKQRVLRKVSYIRRQELVERAPVTRFVPDYLVFEIYNPTSRVASLTLSIRERGATTRGYQRLVTVRTGFTREKIPVLEIGAIVQTDDVFEVELVPNEAEGLTLFFGLIDFVKERRRDQPAQVETAVPKPVAKCKCVVWDLDNTVWEGVLIEDGPEGIRLREGVREVMGELDRRGILQSVASKNNRDDVMPVLEKWGLAEYFLYPQIHWQPKSSSIRAIAEALNIGIDTLMLVDDQEFERQEVSTTLPQVMVVRETEVHRLPDRPEFLVPVTEESRNRRLMYRQEELRAAEQQAHGDDYLAFLRSCGMQVELSPLDDSNIQRVYELAQRTNQMNFSGTRYSQDALRDIIQNEALDTYVIRCADRFGTYGIVGFAVVNKPEPRLLDLMFSCRVQSKRVEHGFIAWLLGKYSAGERDFFVNLRKTSKNAPSSVVFGEMGFTEVETAGGVTTLRFEHDRPVSDDGVVAIRTKEPSL